MNTPEQQGLLLALEYAQNRGAMSDLVKRTNALTGWYPERTDHPPDLTNIRELYLEQGDRWRGWKHAILVVEGFHDPDYDDPITDEMRLLADLLDQKAANRVAFGNIKRRIYALGRQVMKAKP
ncbi:hypothetical protein HB13667_05915 [Pseudomonas putida]|uniref:Uncharacterized protein n=1 Tax=Pseudomonas putida TaxID=303 RepID=A0A0N8HGP9_PSEPU|nr:hypothetical protein [Pseudomonas putida]KPM67580.1 hypothetical protein HB13667_05915 [Pseudomonas putida]